MKLLAENKKDFYNCIDSNYEASASIVLRYRNAVQFEENKQRDNDFKACLQNTSIREGVSIFPFITYRGVQISILDETSLMHTKTLKSIDGCVSIAKSKFRGDERVVLESGGNTGTALSVYGKRVGLEIFLFLPEENISLLNSEIFNSKNVHLIAVKEPGLTKKAAKAFAQANSEIKQIPQTQWRYEASMFRGLSILEHIFSQGNFDWITQTISAAFGPIGIYNVLKKFKNELGTLPRFLGIQQEANCPMYQSWKAGKEELKPSTITSTKQLLTRVMYDVNPHTYSTYRDLKNLLIDTEGDLVTINHAEFDKLLTYNFEGKTIIELLKDNDIEITIFVSEIIEKIGLIALLGTLKEIECGTIAAGSNVLCCLTSGISMSDGKATPEYRISCNEDIKICIDMIFTQK